MPAARLPGVRQQSLAIFSGGAVEVPESLWTVLQAGSGPAYVSDPGGLIDGAVRQGLPRDVQFLITQTMLGPAKWS